MVFAIPSLQHLQTINSITQSTVAHVFYLDQNVRHLFLELHLAWILALGNCNWKPRPGSWFGTCNLDIATWNPDDLHLGLKLENCNLQLQTLTWILVWNLTHTHIWINSCIQFDTHIWNYYKHGTEGTSRNVPHATESTYPTNHVWIELGWLLRSWLLPVAQVHAEASSRKCATGCRCGAIRQPTLQVLVVAIANGPHQSMHVRALVSSLKHSLPDHNTCTLPSEIQRQ